MFDNKPNSGVSRAVPGTAIDARVAGERKNFHYIENIYDPDKHPIDDLNKYVVPQENELVFDVGTGSIYRVTHVDWQGTLKSTLIPWNLIITDEGGSTLDQDYIFGLRGGPMNGEALLSIDYSVRPNVARVDSTIMRPGTSYAKLFLGNDVSVNGTIISAQYDKTGVLLSNTIPVKLAAINEYTNRNIFTTDSFSCTLNENSLKDGTRCTVIFYDEGGNFIPPAQPVMVQHSSYMKDHQLGIRYVTEIELLSPWFTNTNDPNRILVPINTDILTIEFRAVVHYSDGSNLILAVNSNKFSLFGLNQHRPTWPGQESEIVLSYKLADDEQFYLASPGAENHISRTYVIEAGNTQGAYTPKIYTYPTWDSSINGYGLKHFLYDLNRDTRIDVTEYVKFSDTSPVFKPSSYGVEQNLIFNLNLRDVSPTYESIIFKQHTTVTLYKAISGTGKYWDVKYSYNKLAYFNHELNYTNNGANTIVNLKNGYKTQAEWLDALYNVIEPHYDNIGEENAPVPTAFDIMHLDGRVWRQSLTLWDSDINIPIEIQKGSSWYICWIYKPTGGEEQQLAITGVVANPKI